MSDIKTEKAVSDREERSVSETVRRRLPAYYRALIATYATGEEKISSKQLAGLVGSAESQVRTDMLAIGCKGRKGYGYNIASLYKRIGEVMRIRDTYSAVIVGEGAFADAVAASELFTKRGIKLVGRFPDCGSTDDAELISRLERFCGAEKVDILIFACSGRLASLCLSMAVGIGIRGVLNLSETDLYSDKLTVRNIHIQDALMLLCSEI